MTPLGFPGVSYCGVPSVAVTVRSLISRSVIGHTMSPLLRRDHKQQGLAREFESIRQDERRPQRPTARRASLALALAEMRN